VCIAAKFVYLGYKIINRIISGSAGNVISGSYVLTLMDLDTSTLRNTPDKNTIGETRIAVFPNPATDKIYIILESDLVSVEQGNSYEIQIMSPNSLVSMRKNGMFHSKRETIELDISTFPNGLWYVQVSGLDKTITKSVVIQH